MENNETVISQILVYSVVRIYTLHVLFILYIKCVQCEMDVSFCDTKFTDSSNLVFFDLETTGLGVCLVTWLKIFYISLYINVQYNVM